MVNAVEVFQYFRQIKESKMKAALQIELTFDQILALVRQLPKQEKIQLSKELEREGFESKLSRLLNTFKTDDLSLDTINEETEAVRKQLYENQNH